MINLLLGQPGGGKSYEAVAFHILPAVIEQKRKVITNLPLDLAVWESFFPGSTKLIEIRGVTKTPDGLVQPFSRVDHYGDSWRGENGVGPLYVIDECHKPLPRMGTKLDVEEWFAEHRHEGADVLLITQSYGKISQAIRDSVQVVYRCKKATAFGTNDRYIRKVQDGLRGEVVNTSIREYESKYFKLYRSHTKSNGAVLEALSADIVPIWKRWPFKGAALCAVVFIVIVTMQLTKDKKPSAEPANPVEAVYEVEEPPQEVVADVPEPRGPEQLIHPYQGYTMYLAALQRGQRTRPGDDHPTEYLNGYVTITQNGQPIRQVGFRDLEDAGYTIRFHSLTVISLEFKGFDVGYVVSGLPQVSLASKTPDKQTGG
ncbi:zonular occludens toxin domain-containing protein [Pseudomonas sp. zjy_9]